MKKVTLLLLALLMIVASFAGCTKTETIEPEATAQESADTTESAAADSNDSTFDGSKIKIVYLVPSKDILYWQWVEAGVQQACEAIGATCITYDAQNDAATQLNNANTAITQGVAGIVMSPVSSPSCAPVLDAAEAAGIPVTIAAIGPEQGVTNYACLVTADDFTSGYENGKFLCEQVTALGGGT